jgi:hypothetical protein
VTSPIADGVERRAALRGLAMSYLLFAVVAGRDSSVVLCPWRAITGFRCPLCGMTRAVRHALRGDLARSVRVHPAGPISAAILTTLTAGGLRDLWRLRAALRPDRSTLP